HEEQHYQTGQDAAEDEVTGDLVQRRVDVSLLIANDFQLDVRRQLRRDPRKLLFDAADDFDCVGADCRRTSSVTVGWPLSRAIERCSLVPSSTRPMSRILIGAPLMLATTRSSISRGSV